MSWHVKCRHCGHVHDVGQVQVGQQYKDCSTWRCPGCSVLIDDRPGPRGGSERVAAPPAPQQRAPRRGRLRKAKRQTPTITSAEAARIEAADRRRRGIERLMQPGTRR